MRRSNRFHSATARIVKNRKSILNDHEKRKTKLRTTYASKNAEELLILLSEKQTELRAALLRSRRANVARYVTSNRLQTRRLNTQILVLNEHIRAIMNALSSLVRRGLVDPARIPRADEAIVSARKGYGRGVGTSPTPPPPRKPLSL